jgi:hypothetical protein
MFFSTRLVRATAVACGWRDTSSRKRLPTPQAPPLRQRSRASLLVVLPGDEMPLLIKMIVDLSVNRTEFLKRLQASKALHRSLSSSKRLMRVLRPIVEAATDLVPIGGTDCIHRRGIGPTPVGDGSGANCLDTA